MKYISTRGQMDVIDFQDAVMTGLATDGGLILPESLPNITDQLDKLSQLNYIDLAFEIIKIFAPDIPEDNLKSIIDKSYASFHHPEIAPSIKVDDIYILELFHGPTLAFKDFALQLLGNLFAYILEHRGGCLNILGATSGDTGSAAIHGVRGKKNINIFVMHPEGRTSRIQEKQMTSVLDPNVYNLAVDGTFDDCQSIMKKLFSDLPFKNKYSLGAVNSVNWARVLAQMVYYFYATFQIQKDSGSKSVRFSVPTGNFGDILAGYLAKKMGLPIEQLILATNENDILTRFFSTGIYEQSKVVPTVSPSMDIQVASNFERYLYFKLNRDPDILREIMENYNKSGCIELPCDKGGLIDSLIVAGKATTDMTIEMIKYYHKKYDYLLDPHTAVGVCVAKEFSSSIPTICLATAHPAKFTDTIESAIGYPALHPVLESLDSAPTRCDSIDNDCEAVKSYLMKSI